MYYHYHVLLIFLHFPAKSFWFLAFKIASILKNNVPLVSAKPNPLPAILNGWQGNPASKIS